MQSTVAEVIPKLRLSTLYSECTLNPDRIRFRCIHTTPERMSIERMQFESGSSRFTSSGGFNPVFKPIVFICVGDVSSQMIRHASWVYVARRRAANGMRL